MNSPLTSSSGHIIEFNSNTGSGFIQEDSTQRILPIHRKNFKKNSKRYITDDKQYVGELFDFDIVAQQKTTETDSSEPTLEAINIRHRVLKCNVEGCSRIKAFTNVKALEEHIFTRHTSKKNKEATSQPSSASVNISKKKYSQPTTITLSCNVTDAIIGRFIGKQGVNLKRYEEESHVRLKLLNTRDGLNPLKISVKPNKRTNVDIELLKKKLEFQLKLCVRDQQLLEDNLKQRLSLGPIRCVNSMLARDLSDELCDTRYKDNVRYTRAKQLKQQEFRNKRLRRQTEPSIRVHQGYGHLFQEGHRSMVACDSMDRLKSNFDYSHHKTTKRTMKNKQRLVNDELRELDGMLC